MELLPTYIQMRRRRLIRTNEGIQKYLRRMFWQSSDGGRGTRDLSTSYFHGSQKETRLRFFFVDVVCAVTVQKEQSIWYCPPMLV